jgi:hypothetical protein
MGMGRFFSAACFLPPPSKPIRAMAYSAATDTQKLKEFNA